MNNVKPASLVYLIQCNMNMFESLELVNYTLKTSQRINVQRGTTTVV